MAHRITLTLSLALLSLAACDASSSADEQTAVGNPAFSPSLAPGDAIRQSNQSADGGATQMYSIQTLDGKLKKGTAYADLRNLLLGEQWTPAPDLECKDNVGGEASICDEIPELETCSADGFCVMNFQHQASSAKLRVSTYGEYGDWNVVGPESKLAVTGWSFSGDERNAEGRKSGLSVESGQQVTEGGRPMSAEACTLEGHAAFLESFARDEKVRATYTSPQMRIRDFNKLDTDANLIERGKYDQFKIGLMDYRWVYLDPARDENSYERLEVKQKRTGDTLRVDFVKGEFDAEDNLVRTQGKPRAYIFEFKQGCWYLTQDLQ